MSEAAKPIPARGHPSTPMLFRPWHVIVVALLPILGALVVSSGTWALLTGLSVTGVVLLVWVIGWFGPRTLVGPLFFYDLIRLARRGRSTALRCLYALVVLGGLCLVYTNFFPYEFLFQFSPNDRRTLRLDEMARFASSFVTAVLIVQGIAVLVLTPAYLAGAIAEEKERKTLELLFTTRLHDREIVLGKLFARLTHLAGVLLAGLPILSLAQLWGGVDMVRLLAGFAVTGLTLFSVGSLSILCSVLARKALTAVIAAYVIVVTLSVGCLCMPALHVASPIAFALAVEDRIDAGAAYQVTLGGGLPTTVGTDPNHVIAQMVAEYALVHGLIILVCASIAVSQVRFIALAAGEGPAPMVTTNAEPLPFEPVPDARQIIYQPTNPVLLYRSPPVSDRALLWKELFHGTIPPLQPSPAALFFGLLATVLFIILLIGWGYLLEAAVRHRDGSRTLGLEVSPALRGMAIFIGLLWCLAVAFRSANSVVRERDQQTLKGLLTLPVDWEQILSAKWLGSVLRPRKLAYGLAGIWLVGLLTGAIHPLFVPLLGAACFVHVAFLASLGMWVSVHSRTSLQANFSMALLLLIFLGSSWLVLGYTQSSFRNAPGDVDWVERFFEVGLNPLLTWWVLAPCWADIAEVMDPPDLDYAVTLTATWTGLLAYGAAAWVLWRLACRDFRREDTAGG